MQRVTLRELSADSAKYADGLITVAGWVRTLRTSKHLGFIELNDGSCFKSLQIVLDNNDLNNYLNSYLGFVFQEYNILKDLNLYQNISLPLEMQGYSKKEIKEKRNN